MQPKWRLLMNKQRPFTFYLAVIATRFSIVLLRVLGRAGTHVPGRVALALCPNFLKYIEAPEQLIAITGTNGKTTVANMIGDYFRSQNIEYAHNGLGSNIQEGIIVAMLSASTFFGDNKIKVMVLEVDERVSLRIYPTIKPDILIITNLFRDSYKRNAHVEFIASILNDSIPDETTLVVNADDIISSMIKPNNKKVTYGIARLIHEKDNTDSLIHDAKHCPVCHYPLTYTFTRYHHIGHVHCSVCGFTNLPTDVLIQRANLKNNQASGLAFNHPFTLPFENHSMMDLYNRLAALTGLVTLGYDFSSVEATMNQIKTVKTRYQHSIVDGKEIVLILAKDQNPIACSRVFETVSLDTTKQSAVLIINEQNTTNSESENMAWYYDADFERLNKKHIVQVIAGGFRYLDFIVRAKLANISPEKVDGAVGQMEAASKVDWTKVDVVYVLYGTKNIKEANDVKEYLENRIREVTR